MSIAILLGTVGVSADFHICQGKIKTFSFLGQAEQCSKMESSVTCEKSNQMQVHKKKCCSNSTIYGATSFQAEVNAIVTSPLATVQPHYLNKPITHVAIILPQTRWEIHTPPLIRQQASLVIAYQNFLI
jgi:hypothetical protein